MYTDTPAADLAAIEPTADDLIAIERESWRDSQARIEAALAEQVIAPIRRAAVAPVRTLPTRGDDRPAEVVAA